MEEERAASSYPQPPDAAAGPDDYAFRVELSGFRFVKNPSLVVVGATPLASYQLSGDFDGRAVYTHDVAADAGMPDVAWDDVVRFEYRVRAADIGSLGERFLRLAVEIVHGHHDRPHSSSMAPPAHRGEVALNLYDLATGRARIAAPCVSSWDDGGVYREDDLGVLHVDAVMEQVATVEIALRSAKVHLLSSGAGAGTSGERAPNAQSIWEHQRQLHANQNPWGVATLPVVTPVALCYNVVSDEHPPAESGVVFARGGPHDGEAVAASGRPAATTSVDFEDLPPLLVSCSRRDLTEGNALRCQVQAREAGGARGTLPNGPAGWLPRGGASATGTPDPLLAEWTIPFAECLATAVPGQAAHAANFTAHGYRCSVAGTLRFTALPVFAQIDIAGDGGGGPGPGADAAAASSHPYPSFAGPASWEARAQTQTQNHAWVPPAPQRDTMREDAHPPSQLAPHAAPHHPRPGYRPPHMHGEGGVAGAAAREGDVFPAPIRSQSAAAGRGRSPGRYLSPLPSPSPHEDAHVHMNPSSHDGNGGSAFGASWFMRGGAAGAAGGGDDAQLRPRPPGTGGPGGDMNALGRHDAVRPYARRHGYAAASYDASAAAAAAAGERIPSSPFPSRMQVSPPRPQCDAVAAQARARSSAVQHPPNSFYGESSSAGTENVSGAGKYRRRASPHRRCLTPRDDRTPPPHAHAPAAGAPYRYASRRGASRSHDMDIMTDGVGAPEREGAREPKPFTPIATSRAPTFRPRSPGGGVAPLASTSTRSRSPTSAKEDPPANPRTPMTLKYRRDQREVPSSGYNKALPLPEHVYRSPKAVGAAARSPGRRDPYVDSGFLPPEGYRERWGLPSPPTAHYHRGRMKGASLPPHGLPRATARVGASGRRPATPLSSSTREPAEFTRPATFFSDCTGGSSPMAAAPTRKRSRSPLTHPPSPAREARGSDRSPRDRVGEGFYPHDRRQPPFSHAGAGAPITARYGSAYPERHLDIDDDADDSDDGGIMQYEHRYHRRDPRRTYETQGYGAPTAAAGVGVRPHARTPPRSPGGAARHVYATGGDGGDARGARSYGVPTRTPAARSASPHAYGREGGDEGYGYAAADAMAIVERGREDRPLAPGPSLPSIPRPLSPGELARPRTATPDVNFRAVPGGRVRDTYSHDLHHRHDPHHPPVNIMMIGAEGVYDARGDPQPTHDQQPLRANRARPRSRSPSPAPGGGRGVASSDTGWGFGGFSAQRELRKLRAENAALKGELDAATAGHGREAPPHTASPVAYPASSPGTGAGGGDGRALSFDPSEDTTVTVRGRHVSLGVHGVDYSGYRVPELIAAAADGDAKFVREYFKKGPGRRAAPVSRFFTPLHAACYGRPNPAVIRTLINNNADVNSVSAEGDTPLHLLMGNPTISVDGLCALLEGGALTAAYNANGWAAVHIAAGNPADRGQRLLRYLVGPGGADGGQRTQRGETARAICEAAGLRDAAAFLDRGR